MYVFASSSTPTQSCTRRSSFVSEVRETKRVFCALTQRVTYLLAQSFERCAHRSLLRATAGPILPVRTPQQGNSDGKPQLVAEACITLAELVETTTAQPRPLSSHPPHPLGSLLHLNYIYKRRPAPHRGPRTKRGEHTIKVYVRTRRKEDETRKQIEGQGNIDFSCREFPFGSGCSFVGFLFSGKSSE